MELGAMIITFLFGIVIIKFFGNNVLNKISGLFNASFIGLVMKKVSFLLGNIDNIGLTVVFFIICIIVIVLFDIKLKNVYKNKKLEKHSVTIGEGFRENFSENIENNDKRHIKGGLNIDLDVDFESPGFEEFCSEKHNDEKFTNGKIIQNFDGGNVYDKNYTLI